MATGRKRPQLTGIDGIGIGLDGIDGRRMTGNDLALLVGHCYDRLDEAGKAVSAARDRDDGGLDSYAEEWASNEALSAAWLDMLRAARACGEFLAKHEEEG